MDSWEQPQGEGSILAKNWASDRVSHVDIWRKLSRWRQQVWKQEQAWHVPEAGRRSQHGWSRVSRKRAVGGELRKGTGGPVI